VCGAATAVGTRIQTSRQDPRPTDDKAGDDTAEKTKPSALRSSVSLDKRRPHKGSAWFANSGRDTSHQLRCRDDGNTLVRLQGKEVAIP
jgi:hypothetical protein